MICKLLCGSDFEFLKLGYERELVMVVEDLVHGFAAFFLHG